MRTIHQSVRVDYRYPVCFTQGLFEHQNLLLRNALHAEAAGVPKKVLFVVDQGVVRHHPNLLDSIRLYCLGDASLELAGPPLVFEGGEGVKNDPSHVARVHRAVHTSGVDRHSYVVAVGGGAVIDMAGYAAATAHRGVRLVRVPTTVLSQNDSAVGVKNGVNAFGKKNFLGTFAPPYAVLNDFDFLTTLSDRDWRGGISEALKVALLKDATFFGFLEERAGDLVRRDMDAMQWVIYRCAQLHLEHIATSGDPFESGSSRPLDFGHWAAHKLEQLSGYALRHGEAVAVGLALDSTYSYLTGLLSERYWQRILGLISLLGLPAYVGELDRYLRNRTDARCILRGLDEFREHLGGRLTVTLLRGIGDGTEANKLDECRIVESIALLREHQAYQVGGEWHEHAYRHVSANATATY